MRTTLNIEEDALLAAQSLAQRRGISLGTAVSELVRRGASALDTASMAPRAPRRGRFALLGPRDEVITVDHIRRLMEREGI